MPCPFHPDRLYKIVRAAEWRTAQESGVVAWSADDERDGFMHLSTGAQLLETARRHFAGASELVALEIDPAKIEGEMKMEPSRGGALFPHLYGRLPCSAVVAAFALAAAGDGFRAGDSL